MSRARTLRRGLLAVTAVLVVVLAVLAVTAVVVIRRPFPDYGGTLDVAGLDADVTVLRDEQGIPQVYADTAEDLFRAQGFVHAQDRFFQMDFRRHVGSGRLSELVGANEDALTADKVVRTLGWRRVAEQELRLLDPSTRAYLQAYADGVNAYVGDRSPAELSVSYTVLGTTVDLEPIEPWTPVDSLTWLKAMAWELKANYDDELARALIYPRVGSELARVEQLFPPFPYGRHTPIVPTLGSLDEAGAALAPAARLDGVELDGAEVDGAEVDGAELDGVELDGVELDGAHIDGALSDPSATQALQAASRALREIPVLVGRGEGIGSNSWVVSGELTESGMPLLANDSHTSPSVPGIWYQMGLHCSSKSEQCPFDVAGFTFAGMPGVVIGHNDRIAWGFTNLGADVTDFFLERTSGNSYLRDGRQEPLELREEVIEVAGGAQVPITIRSTVHGPIISDVLDGPDQAGRTSPVPSDAPFQGAGYDVSLAWTALTPGRSADAVFALNAATGWQEFREAARLFEVPSQNIVYADVDGRIGYQAPGVIPLRGGPVGVDSTLLDGRYPRLGWDPAYDWLGSVPFEDLPYVLDPEEGFVVAANQAVAGPAFPVLLTRDWSVGYRAERIRELLIEATTRERKLSRADMSQLQLDDRNGFAEVLVPYLLDVSLDDDTFTLQARALLEGWDGGQDVDSAAAAYYNAVWSNLLELTFHDELVSEEIQPGGGPRWFEVVRALLTEPESTWWDDRLTPNVVETRDEILTQALVNARLELTRTLGKDPQGWQWGDLHRLELELRPLGDDGAPGLVRSMVNPDPVRLAGGPGIVNATSWDARRQEDYRVTVVPAMRMVVDLSDLDASTWVSLTGTSGHPYHPNYLDQLDSWAHGRTYPWPFTTDAVRAAAQDELLLRPGQSTSSR